MGINLGRVAVALARGTAGYNKSRYEREQQDFERERELTREQQSEAYRRDQLDARREQAQQMEQYRRDQMQAAQTTANANRTGALERMQMQLAQQRELAKMGDQTRRDIAQQSMEGRENMARLAASLRSSGGGGDGGAGWQLRETADGLSRVNVRTGQVEPLRDPSGQPVKSTARPGTVTQEERRNASLFQFAEPSSQRALDRYSQGKSPSLKDRIGESMKGSWSPDWLGNMIQSDEGQMMYDDLTQIVLATQYVLSGKAVTENEARKLARGLMPQVGDKPERAAQKVQEIKNRMRVLRNSAGRAMDPNAPAMEPTSVDEVNQKYRSTNPFAP
jgi:hypothetical protein